VEVIMNTATERLSRTFWTPGRDALLREYYPLVPVAEIAKALQIEARQVQSRVKRIGLRKTEERVAWLDDEIELLRELYPDVPGKDVAALLDRPLSSVHRTANRLGLKKSEAFKASDMSGRVQRGREDPRMVASRFQKGHVSWNKGKHTVAGGRSAETRFKKGRPAQESHNYVPIGSHKVDRDGYLLRKVTDDPSIFPVRRWVFVHRLVWAEAHGPIPDGHLVRFLPGRFTNVLAELTADRLELVSKAEHARRNHWANHPTLKALIPLKTQITKQVNRINREAKKANERA
jgi:hypothetical protein